MLQLRYTLHGEAYDSTTSSVLVPRQSALTLDVLEANFPFEGQFYFRIKTDERNGNGFYYRDVLRGENVLVDDYERVVDVQALVISAPEDDKDDYSIFYQQSLDQIGSLNLNVASSAPSEESHGSSHPKSSVAAGGLNLNTLAKGATSVWSTLVSTATAIQQSLNNSVPLTDEAEEQLSKLSDALSNPYDASDPTHVAILNKLWTVLFPGSAFEAQSARWKEAGWQSTDPIKDLKQSGLLALQAMVYMGSKYTQRTQVMLASQKANASTNYPFAIVGINLTLLLATIISLKDQGYLSAQAAYWKLFEASHAFNEIFSACFFHLDHIWKQRKATRADFSRIIGEIKVLITNTLNRGPKSVEDFQYLAQEESMVISS